MESTDGVNRRSLCGAGWLVVPGMRDKVGRGEMLLVVGKGCL